MKINALKGSILGGIQQFMRGVLKIGVAVFYILTAKINLRVTCTERVSLRSAPGFGLRNFLGHFCQKKFRENVLEPCHAEALYDYQDALAKKDYVRAKYAGKMIYFWMIATMLKGAVGWVTTKFPLKFGTGD